VAATNRDLKEEVRAGRFRKDLYYRLNIYPIRIPPLRERIEDIGPLADYFLDRYGREYHKPGLGIEPAALSYLKALSWPGNVRELENAIQRAVISAVEPRLRLDQFLFLQESEPNVLLLGYREARARMMAEFQRKYLHFHLGLAGGRVTKACEAMGISRQMLYGWMKRSESDSVVDGSGPDAFADGID
jgi:transcriptional regulator with PAS, ATPase and Fis domain